MVVTSRPSWLGLWIKFRVGAAGKDEVNLIFDCQS